MPDPRRNLAIAGGLLAAVLLCPIPHALAQNANAYCVEDSTSGHILLSKNPNKRMAVGGLTNIATAMVVLDWLEIGKHAVNEAVAIPPEAASFPQNPIGFQPGDQASIRDLLYAALMQSDDIAGYALAMHVGQELPLSTPEETPMQAFVAQMNALARKLGMRNTLFVDATGLELNERTPAVLDGVRHGAAGAVRDEPLSIPVLCFPTGARDFRLTTRPRARVDLRCKTRTNC